MGKLSLQIRKRSDDLGCLERLVSPSDIHLLENPSFDEPLDRSGCRFVGPSQKLCSAFSGQDWGTGKDPEGGCPFQS